MLTLPLGTPEAEDEEGVKESLEEPCEEKVSHVQNNITRQGF